MFIDIPSGGLAVMPTPYNASTNQALKHGASTIVTKFQVSAITQELKNAVEGAGLTLSKDVHNQLFQAINQLITKNSPDLLDGSPKWVSENIVSLPEGFRVKTSTKEAYLTVPNGGLNANILNTGKNGLDIETATNDTWYYLYLIYKPTATTEVATLFSTSPTTPTMPTGFTIKAPLGIALRYRSGGLQPFVVNEKQRLLYWLSVTSNDLLAIGGVVPTTYTDTDLTDLVPPIATSVRLCVRRTGGGADSVVVRPKGMTGGYPPAVSQAFEHNWIIIPFIQDPIIQWVSTASVGTAALDILGYGF
jgi:hypothetical protein